ncbi:pectin lyase-like protein [Polyplosphaeria fusca]|uniref:Pectin lyase-like protein n=1 Tax=Polyplosphaeria fusca TaxID=682080 RepID=A0A9P4R227_9PLEO|nr:pectin lyase-like protein [Polyplosphaeria fusca]
MRISILYSTLLAVASATGIRKRDICIVDSLDDASKDDVPAINAALKECGDTGRVLFPLGKTYNIRSPIDLSPCRACDFQIDGVLRVSSDWEYWKNQEAVFLVHNTTAAVIRSDGSTGLIDGNYYGFARMQLDQLSTPKLFSFKNESYVVLVSSLTVQNVLGSAFYVTNSTGIRIYDVNFANNAAVGVDVDQAKHVYMYNVTLRAENACVRIRPNSSNVQVEQSECHIAGNRNDASGVEFYLLSSGYEWIRNIFVRQTKFARQLNVVSVLTREGNGHRDGQGVAEVFNATFRDIQLDQVKRPARLDEAPNVQMNVSRTVFQGWSGTSLQKTQFECNNAGDMCNWEADAWNITYRS